MTEASRQHFFSWLIPSLTAVVLAVFFVPQCFSASPFHNWDLHGHIALTERLREQGRIFFFDHWWFTGWEAFRYYPPFGQLLAAIFSLPLSLFSNDPVRLSCQIILGLCIVGLPLSMFGMAKELLLVREDGEQKVSSFPLACACSFLAVWFLGHPDYYFGVGAKAGTHLGLFSQLLGWHLLLFYVRTTLRIARSNGTESLSHTLKLALLVALLLLTHALTFLFAAAFGGLYLLWDRAFKPLFLAHGLGIGLSAFWLLPATILGREYAPLDQLPAEGDFVSLILQMTPQEMLLALRPENFFSYSHTPLFLLLAIATLPLTPARKHSRLLAALFFCVFSESFFVSDFFVKNFPFSLHLYRFLGLSVLLFVSLFAVVPSTWVRGRLSVIILSIAILGGEAHELFLWNKRQQDTPPQGEILADEEQLLKDLKSSANPALPAAEQRVLFELAAASETPDYPSPHYLPAKLAGKSERETGNGLFIQSSLTQAFLINTVSQLKIDFYGTPELDTSDENFTAQDYLLQLKDLGISTIVSTKDEQFSQVAPLAHAPVRQFGHFFVYEFGPAGPVLRPKTKHLIGYLDLEGSLPFKIMEYVFYSHKVLWTNSEIISLSLDQPIPEEVELVLINAGDADSFQQASGQLKQNAPRSAAPIRNLKFLRSPEKSTLGAKENLRNLVFSARRYLIGQINLPTRVLELGLLPGEESTHSEKVTPSWGEQTIAIENLKPNHLYRLDYSYSPFWTSDQAEVYRGSAERIWVLPRSEKIILRHQSQNLGICLLGSGVTLFSLAALLVLALRMKRQTAKLS